MATLVSWEDGDKEKAILVTFENHFEGISFFHDMVDGFCDNPLATVYVDSMNHYCGVTFGIGLTHFELEF